MICRESLLLLFDNIPTINGLGLEPLIALRDVKEIIKAVPEVDAVPMNKICELLGKAGPCPPDKEDHERCLTAHCELCWKDYLTNWMEEQNEG